MPKSSEDLIESVDEVIELSLKMMRDPRQCALFFKSLDRALNKDAKGRVSFRTYQVAWRRLYFAKAYDGTNAEALAAEMGVSRDTVENDIRWVHEQRRAKRNGKKTINMSLVETAEKS